MTAGSVLAGYANPKGADLGCDARPSVNWGPTSLPTLATAVAGQGFMGAHYWLVHSGVGSDPSSDVFYWVDRHEVTGAWSVVAVDTYSWTP